MSSNSLLGALALLTTAVSGYLLGRQKIDWVSFDERLSVGPYDLQIRLVVADHVHNVPRHFEAQIIDTERESLRARVAATSPHFSSRLQARQWCEQMLTVALVTECVASQLAGTKSATWLGYAAELIRCNSKYLQETGKMLRILINGDQAGLNALIAEAIKPKVDAREAPSWVSEGNYDSWYDDDFLCEVRPEPRPPAGDSVRKDHGVFVATVRCGNPAWRAGPELLQRRFESWASARTWCERVMTDWRRKAGMTKESADSFEHGEWGAGWQVTDDLSSSMLDTGDFFASVLVNRPDEHASHYEAFVAPRFNRLAADVKEVRRAFRLGDHMHARQWCERVIEDWRREQRMSLEMAEALIEGNAWPPPPDVLQDTAPSGWSIGSLYDRYRDEHFGATVQPEVVGDYRADWARVTCLHTPWCALGKTMVSREFPLGHRAAARDWCDHVMSRWRRAEEMDLETIVQVMKDPHWPLPDVHSLEQGDA